VCGVTTLSLDLNVSGNTQVNGTINSNNTVSGATITSWETYTQNWFRTLGDTGWYSEKWGGGWYMSDSTWIRAYSNKMCIQVDKSEEALCKQMEDSQWANLPN
jgi:hypothetical protein